MDKSTWCASQWQAHIARLSSYGERREALAIVPVHMRGRVISHLETIRKIKSRLRNR
jgi:hypothetical protein